MITESSRLLIRDIETCDLNGFYDLHSNTKVMNMIPTKTLNLEESKNEIEKLIKNQKINNFKAKIYSIILKSNKEFIGTFAVIKISDGIVEIGYRIREKFWRQGFASEATKAMIDYIFSTTKINLIVSVVDSQNIASIKVLDKYFSKTDEDTLEDKTIEFSYELKKEKWINN